MTSNVRCCTLVSIFTLLAAVAAIAGDLNPPAGPITGTMKTLAEVEPRIAINATNTPGDADSLFKITQPGSYYLTGNITGVVGRHGIEIAASGVTLDLMGFDLAGVPAMGNFDGVSAAIIFPTNITIVNGSIRNWGDDGVDLADFSASNCRVDGVLASDNAGIGIVTGPGCTVTNCSAYRNLAGGISANNACTMSDCVAYNNTFQGIFVGSGSTVTRCAASGNTAAGITATAGTTITGCSSFSNGGIGISVSHGCTVADCTVRLNSLDGIRCPSTSVIRGNTCSNNGNGASFGANIYASGADNRIEGNTCTGADRGIFVDAGGNIIVRNACSGNTTNWDVIAGNVILVELANVAGAVVGNAGGIAPGSTDPNANFTY
jgi:parallel beta-helix repeat protein